MTASIQHSPSIGSTGWRRSAALSLMLASLLLTACGGGDPGGVAPVTAESLPPCGIEGSGAPHVRGCTNPPDSSPPRSYPADSPPNPCPSPVTADCMVSRPYTLTWDEYRRTGGRRSDHALTVSGAGWLNLLDGDYRFSGGTSILNGTLVVWDNLTSD